MDAWLVALLAFLAYGALIIILGQTGVLERANITAFGPFLIWRTGRGRAVLERLAKYRRLWGGFARLSVALVFAIMLAMVVTLLVQTAFIARIPADAVNVQYAIGIPGVNPIIPIGFGVLGLAVAIVVHEGCHGILARAEGIKVRSVGLLVVLFPIGAFVEPDEQEMRAAPLPKRQRIYAVGPSSNILLALACAGVFSAGFMGSLAPVDDGVVLTAVFAGSPAANASIVPYTLIDAMEFPSGTVQDITGPASFEAFMMNRTPGENVTVHALYNGERRTAVVSLAERTPAVAGRSRAVMGVIAEAPENFTYSARPGAEVARRCDTEARGIGSGCYAGVVAYYLGMPLRSESPAPAARQALYAPTGAMASFGGAFWTLADMFYWLFWLNFMVGTFNALPMLPLDGGHMYRDGVLALLRRRAARRPHGSKGGDAAATPEALRSEYEAARAARAFAEKELDALIALSESPSGDAAAPHRGSDRQRAALRRRLAASNHELERLAELMELGSAAEGEESAPEGGRPGAQTSPAAGAGAAPRPNPADDLFGPRRFRDALDRRAHTITAYTSMAMLVLILLPFVVPRLLGTGAL